MFTKVTTFTLLCVATVFLVAESLPLKPDPKKITTSPPRRFPNFAYEKERQGYHTGDWEEDTVTEYPVVPAYIKHCEGRPAVFLAFEDEKDEDDIDLPERCNYILDYVRDFRGNASAPQPIIGPRQFAIGSGDPDSENGTYPPNQVKVWQSQVPKGYSVNISLTISITDRKEGKCNDYLSVYADDEVPTMFCSQSSLTIAKSEISQLTIKFHSDNENSVGGFKGNVTMLPKDN